MLDVNEGHKTSWTCRGGGSYFQANPLIFSNSVCFTTSMSDLILRLTSTNLHGDFRSSSVQCPGQIRKCFGLHLWDLSMSNRNGDLWDDVNILQSWFTVEVFIFTLLRRCSCFNLEQGVYEKQKSKNYGTMSNESTNKVSWLVLV